MRRFIIKISITLGIVMLCVFMAEMSLRHLPNDFGYKAEFMDENAKSINTLILGASDGLYGINPDYMTGNTFNLSFVSQTIDYTCFLFNKYIDVMDSLEVVIIPISYPCLFSRLEDSPEYWRCKNYNIYFGDKINLYDSDSFLLLKNYKGLALVKHVIKCCMGQSLYITEKGYGTTYTLNHRVKEWKSQASKWARDHTIQESDYPKRDSILLENNHLLGSLIEKCEEKGILVVLTSTPVYPDYYAACNEEQLNLRDSLCIGLTRNYNNVVFWNYAKDEDFSDDDFYDGCHLSEIGAEKFSKKLDLAIKGYKNNYE